MHPYSHYRLSRVFKFIARSKAFSTSSVQIRGTIFVRLVWKVDLTVRRCFVSNVSGVVCRSVDGTLKHYYKSGGDKICLYEKTSQYE